MENIIDFKALTASSIVHDDKVWIEAHDVYKAVDVVQDHYESQLKDSLKKIRELLLLLHIEQKANRHYQQIIEEFESE